MSQTSGYNGLTMRSALLFIAVWLALFVSVPAWGGADKEAERQRLREEMLDMASRNAWKGVDRMYQKLVEQELGVEIPDHLMGAQAASNLGEMSTAVERLELATAKDDPAEGHKDAYVQAKTQLDDILNRYGKVDIDVANNRLPGLIRFELPFGTEERDQIQVAREVILKERKYRGLLPLGSYMIDGEKFDVAKSEDWQTVKVE